MTEITQISISRGMSLTLLSNLIDTETLKPIPPSYKRRQFFETASGMSYDMPLVTNSSDTAPVNCPWCLQANHFVTWVNAQQQGFAQPNFSYNCQYCTKNFNKNNIGVRRFADEVSRKRAGETLYISYVMIS
jgi:hypothetical protein